LKSGSNVVIFIPYLKNNASFIYFSYFRVVTGTYIGLGVLVFVDVANGF